MKIFKAISLTFLNILSIPLGIILTTGIIWYVLPLLQTTIIGIKILSIFANSTIFWITLGSGVLFLLSMILQKIFNKNSKARLKNLFVHLNSWAIGLTGIGLAIATFVLVNPLIANEVILSIPRKISIGIGTILLVLFHVFSGKLSTIINRRIQAYETAKEMNTIGRGSIVFTNLLKMFELFFPEMIMLLLICFCVSWNVASYFIIILVSCIAPFIGNIEADFNTRAEIKLKKEKEKDLLADKIADRMKGVK